LLPASKLLITPHVSCLPFAVLCFCLCSLSLKLVHDIGYWDTFPDAIGEDMHMFIKAFLRTNGATHLYPIHAPINMLHVQGPNWIMSLWARFLQVRLRSAVHNS
jgi:hypothetical protein